MLSGFVGEKNGHSQPKKLFTLASTDVHENPYIYLCSNTVVRVIVALLGYLDFCTF